ncbi:cupin domain-containing protein [Halorussus halophilus]|uniref:cupin domain-containing protein n=1 Tax=Halorussus halophilus TaxID=2650975 RepID=UPI001301284D|nr:cupin domain-containing protein [Halorussus halophilus]
MEKVDIEDVNSRMGPAAVRKRLTESLGTTDVSLNYYELESGDSFAFGYHAHSDQEEVFYVQSGTVTFETGDEHFEVGAGELVRFAPGEYQQGTNEGSERVVALGLGAPKESGNLDMRRECENCGERTPNRIEMADSGEEIVTLCEQCDAETGRFD